MVKHYDKILDLLESVRETFSFYTLILAAATFLESVYILFYMMVYEMVMASYQIMDRVAMMIWALSSILDLLVTVFICEGFMKEVTNGVAKDFVIKISIS